MIKEDIIFLYYTEHLKVKDIANELDVSPAYVTKIIKQDSRYLDEKQYRKDISNNKRRIDKNRFIKNKRDTLRAEDNYQIVKAQHNQATIELSKSKHLTNESYRKWNYSAYKYNPSKHRYEFLEHLGRSYDVPKYIKERFWWFMNKKEAICYAQVTLDYMQGSKYTGIINPDTLGLEMKQAFKLYPRDIVLNIAEVQKKAREKLNSAKNGCDENG